MHNTPFCNITGQPEIQRRYTSEEYFALEAKSEVRHEYFDGEIFAMAGGTKSHNLITQNMTLALRAGLRGQGCQAFMKNVRLVVQDAFHYTYPDVVVSCDPTAATRTSCASPCSSWKFCRPRRRNTTAARSSISTRS